METNTNLAMEIIQLRSDIEKLQIQYINATEKQLERIEELLEIKQVQLKEKYELIGK